jgi:hypothetical protein
MKFPPPALSIQGKRRNPSPHEDLFVKIATGAVITLTSPIWIPLWILLLPFNRRRERRKREEALAQAALRAKMPPPPPPPPTDPELLPPIPSSFADASLRGRPINTPTLKSTISTTRSEMIRTSARSSKRPQTARTWKSRKANTNTLAPAISSGGDKKSSRSQKGQA